MDLVGQGARRAEGRVEVEAHLGQEREVRPEPGDDDDLVDVGDLRAVHRPQGEAPVGLAHDRLGAEPGDVRDRPAAGRRAGVLPEPAPLLELVVVPAAEGVADARAAQQPRDPGGPVAPGERPPGR